MDRRTGSGGATWLLLVTLVGLLVAMVVPASAQTSGGVVATVVRGPITQVTYDHLNDAITHAEQAGAQALLVELDTPGGGLETTRDIVQRMLGARVPIIVYVSPAGAHAGSAGVFITYAAHVAAMAPGTNIGAATPVDAQGEASVQKIVEDTASFAQSLAEQRGRNIEFAEEAVRDARSITAATALDLEVIDVLAGSRTDLLEQIDGEEIPLASGETVTLSTADASVSEYEMGWARQILQSLANPQLAFLFITLGTLALVFELAVPGIGFGGGIGTIMLVLGFYSLSVLPTNAAGVLLLVIALGFLVAELFVPGVGVLAGAGTVALLVAGLLLFDNSTGITLSPFVLLPTAALAGAGAVGIALLAARDHNRRPRIGKGSLIGRRAQVRTVTGGYAQVFVDGALWEATASGCDLKPGQQVRIVGQEGLQLQVESEEDS